jgi:hypothetical protein
MTPDRAERHAERAVVAGVMVVAAVVGLALVSLAPDRSRPGTVVASPIVTEPSSTTTSAGATAPSALEESTTVTPPTVVDPGALPQTDTKPDAAGAAFATRVAGLWRAIVEDQPNLAMPFFFPRSAYLQVKAVADPALDYESRLVANYDNDIHTLHAELGTDAGRAQFSEIDVPGNDAVLVQPGEESNKLSYWRVYGTLLHYTVNGTTRSFPVTSLISWRGEWYVVHLGEIR